MCPGVLKASTAHFWSRGCGVSQWCFFSGEQLSVVLHLREPDPCLADPSQFRARVPAALHTGWLPSWMPMRGWRQSSFGGRPSRPMVVTQESEQPLSFHQPVLYSVESPKLAEGKQDGQQCILLFPSFLLPHGVHRAIAFFPSIH